MKKLARIFDLSDAIFLSSYDYFRWRPTESESKVVWGIIVLPTDSSEIQAVIGAFTRFVLFAIIGRIM